MTIFTAIRRASSRGEQVHRRAIANYDAFLSHFAAERLALESGFFEDAPTSNDAFRPAAALTDRQIEVLNSGAVSVDKRPWFVRS